MIELQPAKGFEIGFLIGELAIGALIVARDEGNFVAQIIGPERRDRVRSDRIGIVQRKPGIPAAAVGDIAVILQKRSAKGQRGRARTLEKPDDRGAVRQSVERALGIGEELVRIRAVAGFYIAGGRKHDARRDGVAQLG